MSVTVRDVFRGQAAFCASMGSPFTAQLCTLVADRLEPGGDVADRLLDWPGNPDSRADALPLRLAGALHGLVLGGVAPALAAVYPPHEATDDALWDAVRAAFETHAALILQRLESPPQTNEVQRSAALCPGFLLVASRTGLPLAISELGASAGLNQLWDRFAYRYGDAAWGVADAPVRIAPRLTGPTPPLPAAEVVERAGCDRAPPDLADPEDRLRLLSFVWADQAARMERTAAAIALARAAGVAIARADAADWLEARLATARPGRAHVVYHSIVWQYLGAERQRRCEAALAAAGARATPEAPLAWLRLEGDGQAPGAAVTLTLWPSGETRLIARADFHGAWLDWIGWP